MIILIDAYNLIKQVIGNSHASDDQRKQFINELKRYSKKKNHKIVLVFDGGFHSFVTREKDGFLEVIYVGYNHSADDYIKDYLTKNKNQNLILVSSDLELKKKAESLNIEAFDAFEFYSKVKEAFDQKIKVNFSDDIKKMSDEQNSELDELMILGSDKLPLKKDDFVSNLDSISKSAVPKKEKKRDSILKKL